MSQPRSLLLFLNEIILFDKKNKTRKTFKNIILKKILGANPIELPGFTWVSWVVGLAYHVM